MDDFLIMHRNFAHWGFFFFVLGAAITMVWSWRFRALSPLIATAVERRQEACRGVVGAAVWILSLLLIALLMRTTSDLNIVEAVAFSDQVGPDFQAAIDRELELMVAPTVAVVGLAVLLSVAGGLWSGALSALRCKEADHG